MSRLGIVYVTRSFRPLPGGLENVACRLLVELAKRGHEVHVVTPKWQREWPSETDYSGVRVRRIEPPIGRCWREGRYARRLVGALDAIDGARVAIVSGLRLDAQTVVVAARRRELAVVLQPERPGTGGDCHWQIEARGGNNVKHRCYRADRFVALTPLLKRELTAAGYPRARIREVTLGLPQAEPTTQAQKLEARRSLAHADPALVLSEAAQLVVYVGRLQAGKGLETLLEAWRRVVETRAHAILWLVGEGPESGLLRERVFELGLAKQVRITGAFDDVEDMFRAADAAVYPSVDDGLGVGSLEAASYGLPLAIGDTSTHRAFFTPGAEAALVPKENAEALAVELGALLDDGATAARYGAAARARVEREHSLSAMVDAYEAILLDVAQPKPVEARR